MIHCPACSKTYYGSPWTEKPGKLYRCKCRQCGHSWLIDGEEEEVKEGGKDADRLHGSN